MVASTSVRKVVGVNPDAALNSCGLAKPPGRRMSCNTTPPLSLPGRGWGDSGSSGCVGHFGPSYSNSLYDGSQGVHSSLSGGSRGSLSSGVSSGYGDGDEGPIRFRLEDGFSSAEEETWGSEGEIEETTSAGRYAVVGTGRRRVSDGGVAAPRGKGLLTTPPLAFSGRSTAESFGSGCCGGGSGGTGGGGGGGGGGAERASDEEAREALLAPFCGSGGVGAGATDAGRSGASLALGGRRAARKAAVGAGRAKRVVALAPGGDSSSSRPGERGGSRKGAGAAARRGRRCGGSGDGGGSGGSGGGGGGAGRACKRPLRLSRPLFIEIENKASEPPLRVAVAAAGRAGAEGAARRQKGSIGVMGGQRRGQQSNPARPQSARRGDDGELEDSDDEGGAAWCGCAQRCLRQAEVWYQALTGAGSVKFSEVGQASPSSLSAAV